MTEAVPLDVRAVCGPRDGAAAVIVLGERGQLDSPTLSLPVVAAEAHTLFHELHAEVTPRAHALTLLASVIDALGGRPTQVRLTIEANDQAIGVLDIDTERALLEIEVCASQAVALAAKLDLPLVADPDVWARAQRRTAPEAEVAELVNGLQP
jgi:bifunctional DNase/RNase